jgi:hypothetical protein
MPLGPNRRWRGEDGNHVAVALVTVEPPGGGAPVVREFGTLRPAPEGGRGQVWRRNRGTARSSIGQWSSAATSPSAIESHQIRS